MRRGRWAVFGRPRLAALDVVARSRRGGLGGAARLAGGRLPARARNRRSPNTPARRTWCCPWLARLLESWDDPAVWTSTRSIEERQVNIKPTVHATLDAPWRPDDVTEALDLAGHSAVRQLRADDSDRGPQGLVRAYGRTDLTAYADGDSIVVETPDRTLRLSRTDAVKLFFGPERPVSPDVAGLPFVFHAWSADRV